MVYVVLVCSAIVQPVVVVPVPADVHTPLHLAEACFVTSVQLLSDFSTLVVTLLRFFLRNFKTMF